MTCRDAPLTPQNRYWLAMRIQAGHPVAHVAAEAASIPPGRPTEPKSPSGPASRIT